MVVRLEKWIDELEPAMVNDAYRGMVEAIGFDNFIKLADYAGGTTIYIPKAEALIRPIRDKKIKDEFNGFNHQELAKKYNLSERWIRAICGEGSIEGQISLEEYLKL